jgi:Tfp pilus assembly protein PilF
VLSIAAAIYGYRELASAALIIEPINVSKQYADAGITPEVMASRIKDALIAVEAATKTLLEKDRLVIRSRSDMAASPDPELLGTKLGLKSVIEITRNIIPFLPQPQSVGGEITLSTTTNPNVAKVPAQDKTESKVQITLRIMRGLDSPKPIVISPTENDPDKAAQSAAEAILGQINPYVLGLYRLKQGDANSAIAIAQAMLRDPSQDRPHQIAAHNLLGRALRSQKKYDEAIAEYRKAIQLDPNYELAYVNWGVALRQQGKYDEAIAKYRKAVELEAKDADAYNDWGNVLFDQMKYDAAIAMYQKAVKLDPKYADAYNNWGEALDKLGRTSEAQEKHAKYSELK